MDRTVFSAINILKNAKTEREKELCKEKIDKTYMKSKYNVDQSFKHHESDIKAITSQILQVKDRISTNLKQVQTLRSDLGSCKRLLFIKREEVSNAWMKKRESDYLVTMVKDINKIVQSTDKIPEYAQHGNFLAASEIIKNVELKLDQDMKLRSVLSEFYAKIGEKKKNLSLQIESALKCYIYADTLKYVENNFLLSKRNLSNFNHLTESNELDFNDNLISNDQMQILKNKFSDIVQTLLNLDSLNFLIEHLYNDIEDSLSANIYKLMVNLWSHLNEISPQSLQVEVSFYSSVCLFFGFKSLLIYCANVLKIFELLMDCIKTFDSNNKEIHSHANIMKVYANIQNVIVYIFGNLHGENSKKVEKICKKLATQQKSNEFDGGKGDGLIEDDDKQFCNLVLSGKVPDPELDTRTIKYSLISSNTGLSMNSEKRHSHQDSSPFPHAVDIFQIINSPVFSQSHDIKNLKYTYRITHQFSQFIEENMGQRVAMKSSLLLKNFMTYFISKIYLDQYISASVSNSLNHLKTKLSTFEVVSLPVSQNLASSDQDQANKQILLVIYNTFQISETLLENISFLNYDWNHSNRIFEHLTRLLKDFQKSLNTIMNDLLSMEPTGFADNDRASAQQQNQPKSLTLSTNLVMDEKRFKSFYRDFGCLIDADTQMETIISTKEWFESEYSILKSLNPISTTSLVQPRFFHRISVLSESLFWFARCFSKSVQNCAQSIQDASLHNCQEILAMSAKLMLVLRVELKLRLLLHFDSKMRLEKRYKETISSLISLISDTANNMPNNTKKVVFWGFGSFLRLLILNQLQSEHEYPTVNVMQSLRLADEVLLCRLILYDVEPNLVTEMEKLIFFCEFLALCIEAPHKIINHAKNAKKFTYFEYKVLLSCAQRNLGKPTENQQLYDEQKKELANCFADA